MRILLRNFSLLDSSQQNYFCDWNEWSNWIKPYLVNLIVSWKKKKSFQHRRYCHQEGSFEDDDLFGDILLIGNQNRIRFIIETYWFWMSRIIGRLLLLLLLLLQSIELIFDSFTKLFKTSLKQGETSGNEKFLWTKNDSVAGPRNSNNC